MCAGSQKEKKSKSETNMISASRTRMAQQQGSCTGQGEGICLRVACVVPGTPDDRQAKRRKAQHMSHVRLQQRLGSKVNETGISGQEDVSDALDGGSRVGRGLASSFSDQRVATTVSLRDLILLLRSIDIQISVSRSLFLISLSYVTEGSDFS